MSYQWNRPTLGNLLTGIAGDVTAALKAATEPVSHVVISPGAQPADDWCNCGQLTLWCTRKYRTKVFPNDDGSSVVTNCDDFKIAFDCRARLVRCIPGLGVDGQPPSDSALTQATVLQEQDGWVVWNTLSCGLEEMTMPNVMLLADWQVYDQSPVGPLGDCAGTETSFRFSLVPQCCPTDATLT